MIREPISKPSVYILGLLSVLMLIGIYSYLSYRQHQVNPNDKTVPTWSQLKEGVQKSVSVNKRSGDRWLLVDATATVGRLFAGLALAITGALILGMLMGCFAPIEAFLYPPLAFFAKIPPIAMLAVFFVLFGTDTKMMVMMIAFGVLPTLAQSVFLAAKTVPKELQYKAYTLGASHAEVIWNVLFRQILPRLFDEVRLQIGPAMVYLIAAEMVVGEIGFGYRIRLQFKLNNMTLVYPYLVYLGGFGLMMDFGLKKLQRGLFPWYVKEGK
jgi:NitT/TauT family transport system permease protein